ncbi:MAG TPA: hypothetical protein VIM56_06225 [Rhizomicrobium sp.]
MITSQMLWTVFVLLLILSILLAALRYGGIIGWSWWLIMTPAIVAVGVPVLLTIGLLAFIAFLALTNMDVG